LPPLDLAARQREHLMDRVVDIEGCPLRLFSAHESPDPLDDLARAISIADDAVDQFQRLFYVGRPLREPPPAGVGAGNDGTERLIDLMGDQGCKLTHHHETRDLRQLRAGGCQRRLHGGLLSEPLDTPIVRGEGENLP
jgi:hypothetical protein